MRAAIVLVLALAAAACGGNDSVRKPQPERASDINLELGIDYLRKGNLNGAKEKIDRAVEQNPRNAQAQSVAGMLYDRLGETNKADAHYQRAVSLEPKNPDILNNYAAYLCQKNRYERGEKYALEAASNPLYRTPEIGFLNAGNCARNGGNLVRAEEHYRRALRSRPRFGEALLQLAELEFGQAEYLSARAFLERYMEVGRASPQTLWLGLRIERSLGNEPAALHYARRLKSEYPNAPQTKELIESERNAG